VQSAIYIYNKLRSENLMALAFHHDKERCTEQYSVVCTGHSLGGGTAAILAILLRQDYPGVKAYAFSPPGGLLSEEAMVASRSFMVSVVVGKDIVPRLGMHQLEKLRLQLMAEIRNSNQSKWATIGQTFSCCRNNTSNQSMDKSVNMQPLDSLVNLSTHQPLYPPGRIIHLVRQREGTYKAAWADNKDFDQVLISKWMIQDHMPDNVLFALQQIICTLPSTPASSPLEPLTDERSVEHVSIITEHSDKVLDTMEYISDKDTSDNTVTNSQRLLKESSPALLSLSAPLASPEAMSDTASLSSRQSQFSRDYRHNEVINTSSQHSTISFISSEYSNKVKFKQLEDSKVLINPNVPPI